jgi:hypothetical protein
MRAKIENDYMTIKYCTNIDDVICCVVDCNDYDDFTSLPQVISYNGILCGKSGWNSDINEAYYQSNASLVRKVG